MALYQSGEVGAFEVLFQRHSGKVFSFLRRRAAPELARELTQETFLKVHRARHQYSAQYPFLPWLFTITRNALVDHARLQESKLARESVGNEDSIPASQPLEEPSGDLAGALESLPAPQRRAIELRYLQDWSFEQIAAELKTSPVNIRQVISRGLRKLRSSFGGSHD